MSKPDADRRIGPLKFVDLRSQFVLLLLAILGLFVSIASWYEWWKN